MNTKQAKLLQRFIDFETAFEDLQHALLHDIEGNEEFLLTQGYLTDQEHPEPMLNTGMSRTTDKAYELL